MARATVNTSRRMIYDNLGITDVVAGYGTYLSNQRYLEEYIDDALVAADIETIDILFKNKQDSLLSEIYQTTAGEDSGASISQNWIIIAITTAAGVPLTQIPYSQYETMLGGGIFDVTTYPLYYAIRNGMLFTFSSNLTIVFIDITHPVTLIDLKSPSGFESALADLATSKLLMKRGDKPDEAKYRKDEYDSFMQKFMIPESNRDDKVDD